jgi:hypothetical protein
LPNPLPNLLPDFRWNVSRIEIGPSHIIIIIIILPLAAKAVLSVARCGATLDRRRRWFCPCIGCICSVEVIKGFAQSDAIGNGIYGSGSR